MKHSPISRGHSKRFDARINLRVSRVGMKAQAHEGRALVAVHDVHASLPLLIRSAGVRPLPGVREICRAAAGNDFEHFRSVSRDCETSMTGRRLKAWGLALLLAAASLAGTATDHDTEAEQFTADLVELRGAEHAQLQADLRFAEVSQ